MKIIHIFTEIAPLAGKNRHSEFNKQFMLSQNNNANIIVMPWYNNLKINEQPQKKFTDKNNKFEVFKAKYPITDNTFYLIKPYQKHYPFFNHELNIHTCLIHFYESVISFIESTFDQTIVHLVDFLSAPISYLIKSKELQNRFKTILSLKNINHDLNFYPEHYAQFSTTNTLLLNDVSRNGAYTAIKCGILFADLIVFKSKYYAEELQSPENDNEYQKLLANRSDSVYGIMNGVQYSTWNPQNDTEIQYQYDTDNLELKLKNKTFLQKKLKLTESDKIPMFFYGTRLDVPHGIEIIIDSLAEIADLPLHLVIKGTGDEELILKLENEISNYKNIRLIKGFNLDLIHEILAASEFILLPSISEADGVSFLYALSYGLVPIAHKVGGHRDAVVDISTSVENPNLPVQMNGFFFSSYYSTSLIQIMEEAISVYKDRKLYLKYQTNCMTADWSWKKCIKQYQVLYQKLYNKQEIN